MTRSDPTAARRAWALWNLRALQPHADAGTLAELETRRDRVLTLERRVLREGRGDPARLLADARVFLEAHPELRSGLVLTLHMGPYGLLPALYLDAGVEPAVVLDGAALARIRPDVERRRRELGLGGAVRWITTDRPLFAVRLLRDLRAGVPVLVFLDGNAGAGGLRATRDRGMPYRLPGRTIRVRTGLGRLIRRTGCPVHAVSVRWREDGALAWRCVRPGAWDAAATARQITRQLYDWLFDEVARSPEQWSFWPMLARASECFTAAALAGGDGPDALAARRARFARALARPAAVRVRLADAVEVWEPDILADLARQRFWSAAGLRDADLAPLRAGAEPSLAELAARHGAAWVDHHGRRLHLLGLLELREPS